MSMLDGKNITLVREHRDIVGSPENHSIELWTTDGVITVTKKWDIEMIKGIVANAKKFTHYESYMGENGKECWREKEPTNEDVLMYLKYSLIKEGW